MAHAFLALRPARHLPVSSLIEAPAASADARPQNGPQSSCGWSGARLTGMGNGPCVGQNPGTADRVTHGRAGPLGRRASILEGGTFATASVDNAGGDAACDQEQAEFNADLFGVPGIEGGVAQMRIGEQSVGEE